MTGPSRRSRLDVHWPKGTDHDNRIAAATLMSCNVLVERGHKTNAHIQLSWTALAKMLGTAKAQIGHRQGTRRFLSCPLANGKVPEWADFRALLDRNHRRPAFPSKWPLAWRRPPANDSEAVSRGLSVDASRSRVRVRKYPSCKIQAKCGCSSVDRVLASEAKGRGFDPRQPHQVSTSQRLKPCQCPRSHSYSGFFCCLKPNHGLT